MSCAPGFVRVPGSGCRMDCPTDFKYEQRPGGDACVYSKDNRWRVNLNAIGIPVGEDPRDSTYTDERNRFNAELTKTRELIRNDEIDTKALQDAKAQSAQWTAQSGNIASEAAVFRTVAESGKAIRDATSSIRGLRAPTAPSTDLDNERRAISLDLKQSLTFLQVVLFLVVLSLVAYLVLPIGWAHSIVFMLLCVGVATGFFLRK